MMKDPDAARIAAIAKRKGRTIAEQRAVEDGFKKFILDLFGDDPDVRAVGGVIIKEKKDAAN